MIDNTVTLVVILLIAYTVVATIAFWVHRPPVGRDPNSGRFRSTRLMWRERQR